MLHRFRFLTKTFLVLPAVAAMPLWAFQVPNLSKDIFFAANANALPAELRNILPELLERTKTWCPLTDIVVVGFADRSEGLRGDVGALARSRANYVAELLRLYGAPASIIWAGIGEDFLGAREDPSWNGKVEINALGWRVDPNCQHPKDGNGYFLRPAK